MFLVVQYCNGGVGYRIVMVRYGKVYFSYAKV